MKGSARCLLRTEKQAEKVPKGVQPADKRIDATAKTNENGGVCHAQGW